MSLPAESMGLSSSCLARQRSTRQAEATPGRTSRRVASARQDEKGVPWFWKILYGTSSHRVTPDRPMFTFVRVDYFGPLNVKQGRSMVLRHGCLFTCLTARAVHIEVAHSLDMSSFINALVRFINRRGRLDVIRSDNGTNFKGGERELWETLNELNQSKIHDFLLQKNIIWTFNPLSASHMSGVWEWIMISVRKILTALVK